MPKWTVWDSIRYRALMKKVCQENITFSPIHYWKLQVRLL